MSSNLIKAFAISYDKEAFKRLDFKEREERIFDRAVEMSKSQFPNQDFSNEDFGDDGFRAGLVAETIPEEALPEEEIVPMSSDEIEEFRENVRNEVIEQVRAEAYEAVRAEMQQELDQLSDQLRAEAEQLRQEIVEQAKAEAESAKSGILSLASSQGYQDGLNRAKAEENEVIAKLEQERADIKKEYERQVLELEPAFVEILKEYVRKISGIMLNNHTEVLTYLIDCGVNKAPKDTDFIIKLNPEDYDRLSVSFSDICLKYEEKLSLQFDKDSELSRGELTLENKEKVIRCGLGATMEGLLDSLDMISE